MTDHVQRRSFLGRLAAVGAAVAGVVALPSSASAESHHAATGPASEPADAWLDDFKGRHKNIYDCTSPANTSEGFGYARNFFIANTGEIYKLKDEDLNVLVSVRHMATVFGFNDAMWAKYKLGELAKAMDGTEPATRNTQTRMANDLAKRGVVVTVCGLATGFFAGQAAKASGLKAADIEADLRANLVTPNAQIVAAGVVIVNRAQEKGFSYTYVG